MRHPTRYSKMVAAMDGPESASNLVPVFTPGVIYQAHPAEASF